MTIKIGIIGGPGTGKSTLARQLVQELSKNAIAEYVPEYASRYIKEYGIPSELWEQVRIFNKQVEWESRIPNKVEYYVSDCPVILPFVYAIPYYNPKVPKSRLQFCDVFKMITKESIRYDFLFYLPPELTPKDDGTRYHLDKDSQEGVDRKIVGALEVLNVSYITIKRVDLSARVQECLDHIFPMDNFENFEVINEDKNLVDLHVGGISRFKVDKDGNIDDPDVCNCKEDDGCSDCVNVHKDLPSFLSEEEGDIVFFDKSAAIVTTNSGEELLRTPVKDCLCGGDDCNCGQLPCGCYEECQGHDDKGTRLDITLNTSSSKYLDGDLRKLTEKNNE